MIQPNIPETKQPRIVIVGGGFGGVNLAKHLKDLPVQVVLLDRNNYHLFQPLLYQVSTAGLEPDSIAFPLRAIFRKQKNLEFRMAEVTGIRPEENILETGIGEIHYDHLIFATGSNTNFFGNKGIEANAIGMKSLIEAVQIRNYVVKQFEESLLMSNPDDVRAKLNFVMVGGGPTGVELAGAFAELRKYIMPKDYPSIPQDMMNVYLIEASPRVLNSFSEETSRKTLAALQDLGVRVMTGTGVKEYDGKVITLSTGEQIATQSLLWAAGVRGIPVKGIPQDIILPNGRILVNEFNQVKGFTNVYAIGDIAQMTNDPKFPKGYPMVAQVAIQQGVNLAANLKLQMKNKPMKGFTYKDLGSMATIGRNRAVAEFAGMKLSGYFAWIVWMIVHLMSLMGFRNKLVVFINWFYRYFTFERGTRIIIKRGAANIVKLKQSVQ
ncbi:NADH dehydrogenase [Chitinophaga terrae (ex Kim and Jung 2007)]|jgi:NADH dehydrogenase|uniref:NADH:ubiquinone reductase (non-electrogenic) n=1 Tax=Chitinophaga terrae (ex Kim and Jung 2007) TaxID=408074 RepID=A0A1H4A7B6_9BACT|nr:NAD(P)/FAD-dependent oxidoreductase [Chitinophaga terrae (ex Kim and Jung 2007)]MDQ0106005.1 NADH dehydrogenase [Chitinophaga terrae (ex Kim and Jung 2007)]GEP90070.1 NADH dehydrogenase [Chitinophaga terrae (ex Kim and Jung 2007)]SEA31472.1 NADH dehydrogenase [Chitinophaga terrae (ex Kim and Jung 2007)]